MLFTTIRIAFKILEWLIAYIIEMIKGDPELADLVRKNKMIFGLTILVGFLFLSNCWQYYNFIKADEALKQLMITTEAITGEHNVLVDEHRRTVNYLSDTRSRVATLEEDAVKHARIIAEDKVLLSQKDHIISELTDTKDDELRKKLLARLAELTEEK